MHPAVLVAILVAGIVALTPASDRLRIPYPVLLTLFGLVVPLLPGVPSVSVDPDLILPLVLPPLLFAATQRSTAREFRESARPIALLAVGLTLASALAVTVLAHGAGLGWGPAAVLGGGDRRGSAPAPARAPRHDPRGRRDVQRRDGPRALQRGRRGSGSRARHGGAGGAQPGTGAGRGSRSRTGRGDRDQVDPRLAALGDGRDDGDDRDAVRRVPRGRPAVRLRRPGGPHARALPADLRCAVADLRRLAARASRLAVRGRPNHQSRVRVHRVRAHRDPALQLRQQHRARTCGLDRPRPRPGSLRVGAQLDRAVREASPRGRARRRPGRGRDVLGRNARRGHRSHRARLAGRPGLRRGLSAPRLHRRRGPRDGAGHARAARAHPRAAGALAGSRRSRR
ncbi:hypothetical protein D1825_05025 [Cellulomonas rhizosphaerae]|uniref:Cation/H+ exchanger transmembrane domain-containing protein n=1 Tax=Cellulomonas rhizosphaerae TaxID=2293719 RepID=A0A413RP26_9CELL|nr:hypothetical protein D1825_05025 [Cellulomonas rhizosphaerae]